MPSHVHVACLPWAMGDTNTVKHCPCFREDCKLGKETDTEKIALNPRTQRVIKACRSTGQDIGGKKLSLCRFVGESSNQEGDPGCFVLHRHLTRLEEAVWGPHPGRLGDSQLTQLIHWNVLLPAPSLSPALLWIHILIPKLLRFLPGRVTEMSS